jgi:hypothetical protein
MTKIKGSDLVFACFDSCDKTTLEAIDSTVMTCMIQEKSSVPVILVSTNP